MEIRVTVIRGGTSKCVIIREDSLPPVGSGRDRVVLALFGSPDPRQIDGIGGATPLTSKLCVVGPPSRAGADLDYTFGQVSIGLPTVDWSGNCGNCLSALGPYAVNHGWVDPVGSHQLVRVHNTNTGRIVHLDVPLAGGRASTVGDYAIPGVLGEAPRIQMRFCRPAGSLSGRLLPTGSPVDIIDGVALSVVDAGNPVAFLSSDALGLAPSELMASPFSAESLALLDQLRNKAGQLAGLRTSAAVPKVAVVARAIDYMTLSGSSVAASDVQLCARMLSMGTPHPAFAVTGAVALAAAAVTEGTVVSSVRSRQSGGDVVFGHPAGAMDVSVSRDSDGIASIGVGRTARELFHGTAYVDDGLAAETDPQLGRVE